MRNKFFVPILTLAVLAWPALALASTVGVGKDYTVRKGKVVAGNLYAGSGNITVTGDVIGDLTAAGGGVLVTGKVAQDVLAAGGSVDLFGDVGSDIRAAGGRVNINGTVSGDVLAAGGMVQILSGAIVKGDVLVAGGSVVINGTVNGSVRAGGGSVVINGTVLHNVDVKAGKTFEVGSSAVINGDVTYRSPKELKIAEGALIRGKTLFAPLTRMDKLTIGGPAGLALKKIGFLIGLAFLLKLLAVFALALVLVLPYRKLTEAVSHKFVTRFWHSLWLGLVNLIVVPVAAVILIASVIGLLPGVLLGLLYAALLLTAHVYAGIFLGGWLSKKLNHSKALHVTVKSALVGVVALDLIGFIPFAGWLVKGVFFLAALGSLATLAYEKFWEER